MLFRNYSLSPEKVHLPTQSKKIFCVCGNSLAVQWLGLRAFTAEVRVRSLVGELRSCKPRSVAKK